ncbi:uncharacterized protein BDR25DRAFT_307385 [Lindgomyces ingoldianus]|uniref:Uncharacterized protein n=1 Tax=Lindgomyces ingoldianus TaxID=673940 RepID=A0ACB6QC41_9PLEO|nr:uncharacterized protein BDR25DRAFT_307385 [Lindgomyces ingoldianus]KAF2464065.1 hypothetical protein BDR25DRAFT_307385 [Lindgomyces ingoldianus]
MLHRLGRGSLCHPQISLPIRTITTVPKTIPGFLNTWDPSSHGTLRAARTAKRQKVDGRDAAKDAIRRAVRKEIRNKDNVTITGNFARTDAVRRLNYCLLLVDSKGCNDDVRSRVWRAYSLAKRTYPQLPLDIPNRAWDILWATQSIKSMRNRSRDPHLCELYRDMRATGKPTTVKQRIAYLEGMFLTGEEEKALKEWEDDYDQSNNQLRHDFKPEHLEAGARMYALAGNADRARGIMDELFELYPDWDPTIIMAVFRAHTRSDLAEHHDIAQKMYSRMKDVLGDRVTLRDYDSWFVGFLEARHLSYSKKVFKEMVTHGFIARDSSQTEINEVLRRLHLLYRLGTDIEKMSSIALQAITILPPSYRFHLFGDWVKSAAVNKAPEAAAQILEMMMKRGYDPQTFHFNLLLKALFRSKKKPNELKAENMAWRMIEAYRSWSEPAHSLSAADAISKHTHLLNNRPSTSELDWKTPPANVTTFALLMQWHANHAQWEHVDYLTRWLRDSKLAPNTAVMNIMLENQCRQGKYNEVWNIYRSLADVLKPPVGGRLPGVFPDGATFRCLWKTLRLALGDHETRHNSTLPSSRDLLKETLCWWDLVRSRHDAERFRIGLAASNQGALNTLVMHCFSYDNDLTGSLVAMHVFRKKFGLFPSNKSAQILQNQIAWVDARRSASTSRRQHQNGVFKRDVEKMARVYHMLMQKRFERTNMTGQQFSYLSEAEIADMNLNLLSEFVRVILKRKHTPEVVEGMIDQAKAELGFPEMKIGDLDAYSVA